MSEGGVSGRMEGPTHDVEEYAGRGVDVQFGIDGDFFSG